MPRSRDSLYSTRAVLMAAPAGIAQSDCCGGGTDAGGATALTAQQPASATAVPPLGSVAARLADQAATVATGADGCKRCKLWFWVAVGLAAVVVLK